MLFHFSGYVLYFLVVEAVMANPACDASELYCLRFEPAGHTNLEQERWCDLYSISLHQRRVWD